MPVIKHELGKTIRSKRFLEVDHTDSYWQPQPAVATHFCPSVITPDGIVMSTRVIQKATIAVLHLQYFLSTHHLAHFSSRPLSGVATFVSVRKRPSHIYALCVWFLSSKFNGTGSRILQMQSLYDWSPLVHSLNTLIENSSCPLQLDRLTSIERSNTDGQLPILLSARKWLRAFIASFRKLVRELQHFLKRVHTHASKEIKLVVALVLLKPIRVENPTIQRRLSRPKRLFRNKKIYIHRNEAKRLCAYTDTSHSYW